MESAETATACWVNGAVSINIREKEISRRLFCCVITAAATAVASVPYKWEEGRRGFGWLADCSMRFPPPPTSPPPPSSVPIKIPNCARTCECEERGEKLGIYGNCERENVALHGTAVASAIPNNESCFSQHFCAQLKTQRETMRGAAIPNSTLLCAAAASTTGLVVYGKSCVAALKKRPKVGWWLYGVLLLYNLRGGGEKEEHLANGKVEGGL